MQFHKRRALLILLRSSGVRSLARGIAMPHFSATARTDSGKRDLVHLHHEFENVAARAAPEAVINLLHRMHRK